MSETGFYGCYWPDHSPAYNTTPCNAEATQSSCCGIDSICLDNGYCLQTLGVWSNRIGRHACTDKTWSSLACAQYCADTRTYNSIGLYLAYDTPNGNFCCDVNYNSTTEECEIGTRGSTAPFGLIASNVIYNRTNGAIIPSNGTLTLDDLGITSSSNTTSASSTQAATSSTATVTTTSSSSNIVPVAVGIAVPLAVLLIAALIACGVLVAQNRRLRREKQAITNASASQAPGDSTSYGRQSALGPAPVYEYKQPPASATDWTPFSAQSQSAQQQQQGGHYSNSSSPPPAMSFYGQPAHSRPEAVETDGTLVGELEGQELPKHTNDR